MCSRESPRFLRSLSFSRIQSSSSLTESQPTQSLMRCKATVIAALFGVPAEASGASRRSERKGRSGIGASPDCNATVRVPLLEIIARARHALLRVSEPYPQERFVYCAGAREVGGERAGAAAELGGCRAGRSGRRRLAGRTRRLSGAGGVMGRRRGRLGGHDVDRRNRGRGWKVKVVRHRGPGAAPAGARPRVAHCSPPGGGWMPARPPHSS